MDEERNDPQGVAGPDGDPAPSGEVRLSVISSTSVEGDAYRPPVAVHGPIGGASELADLLDGGGAPTLILPAEAFVYFYPATPEQLINALYAAGFGQIFFETLGDELVALEYLRLWQSAEDDDTWIRSTSPLVVEYCRAKHPELLPFLAPVVPPALAVARYLRGGGHEYADLVYAGLDMPEVNGERQFVAAVSFAELSALLAERRIDPEAQPAVVHRIPPERRRYLSAAGGLPLAMLDSVRMSSSRFRKLRGLHTLAGLSRVIVETGRPLGFIDILPFDGGLDHPVMGPPEQLYWRRDLLSMVEPGRAQEPVIDRPRDLDLSVRYRPRESTLPAEAVAEIERALEEVQDQADTIDWMRCARDFAGYVTLAESLVRTRPELALGLLYMSRNYYRAIRDATHDALTDLYSYRALVERAREELGQANRAGSTLSMLFLDLDNFKDINDTYGHSTGNEVLRNVARTLEVAIRSTDIAGRFGGDEFVVLLINADFDGARRVAEQIREHIEDIRIPVDGGQEVRTTTSIGIVTHTGAEGSQVSADDLFAEADAALYIAKAHGGNRVHPVVREGVAR